MKDTNVLENQPRGVKFSAELNARYGGRGPRYTSYPTALQFNPDFTTNDYQVNALASNHPGKRAPLSLYVHIPFCRSLCYYCACNKIVTRNEDRVNQYLHQLYREITMQAALFDDDRLVEQIHFGGGTPTYLSHDQLQNLLDHLATQFQFDHSDSRQFSIEIDPRTVTLETLDLLGAAGFNRLSLGVQDFDPRVQKAVNRSQTADEVQALTNHARKSGFRSVSFDLIYGLPKQSIESFARTIEQIIAIRPDRIAVYNYAHLPQRFKGQRMIKDADLPNSATKFGILEMTIDRLSDASYEYIGMDHFALPDDELVKAMHAKTLHRNFQGYSTHRHCDLVGLGVSAIGKIDNVFAQNVTTTSEYQKLVSAGKLPVVRGVRLNDDDLIRAGVIHDIMCDGEISFDSFTDRFNICFEEYFAGELSRIGQLVDDGLVELDANGIKVTNIGRMLQRAVAMIFDRYLNKPEHLSSYSMAN